MNEHPGRPAAESPRLGVDEARAKLLAELSTLRDWECVGTRAALGRVLACPVVAPFDVPGDDSAAMAGYAIGAADVAAAGARRIAVVGTAARGRPFSGVIGPGQGVRVDTGAPLPRGAAAVVPRERATLIARHDGDIREHISFGGAVPNGDFVRRAGENLARGRPALPAGKRIGPAELGVLASLGVAEVTVVRRLRVAILSVGDDLRALGRPLGPGEVYDSNRYTLFGALTELGVEVIDLGASLADAMVIEQRLTEAAGCADVILTTGLAPTEESQLQAMLDRLGRIECWRLDLKPGRPLLFGRIGEAWLFGLPGNPVAVMVSFYQFLIDGLLRLMGVSPIPVRPIFRVPTVESIVGERGRREYRRGVLSVEAGEWRVRLAGIPGSGVLRSMSEANCFIVLDPSQVNVSPGDLVAVQMFEGLF